MAQQPTMVVISHDGFARTFLVRMVEKGICQTSQGCSECGGTRRQGEGLWRYGTQPEDSGRANWHKGYFCGKGCHDSYHG